MNDVTEIENKLETPTIIEFDWGGNTEYVKGKDGVYYVDPVHISKFKEEHGV